MKKLIGKKKKKLKKNAKEKRKKYKRDKLCLGEKKI